MKAFVLVGAPGAGKSTLAEQLKKREKAVIVSGDDIKFGLYGEEGGLGLWTEIDDQVESMISDSSGLPVILDGTYYLPSYRREAIALLNSYGYDEVEAIVVNTPLEDCIFRNATRHRGVPRHVVVSMHEMLELSLGSINTEGFTKVTYHEN